MQRLVSFLLILSLFLLAACEKAEQAKSPALDPSNSQAVTTKSDANVFEFYARGTHFEGPHEVPSGWVTFVFHNESSMTHFASIELLPDGIDVEQMHEAGKIFQDAMDLINQGDEDAGMKRLGDLPPWMSKIVYSGGPGFLAGGHTSRTTVYLKPGRYQLECYVKTDGRFHSYNPDPAQVPMVHGLNVTEADGGAQEPVATVEIDLSSERGIQASDTLPPGKQVVAVHFLDQKVYGNFSGHDVQLVRINADADIGKVSAWMNWLDPNGLETPAPAEFLGGTQNAPAGATVYFTVDLEPGRYAWVAEVPNPAGTNLMKEFTVASAQSGTVDD